MTKPTREQILSEPAGERLDAWVAEFVKHDVPGQVWTRPYSTDIASAWEVVEKIRRRFCCVQIDMDYHYRTRVTIKASDDHGMGDEHPTVAEVETDGGLTALCLSRAALLAVLDEG